MNKEELLTTFSDILKEKNILTAKGIHEVNHRPHQFTIGEKHIEASNKPGGGGILTEDILEEIGCAHRGCSLSYAEHESDKTLFLQLTRDVTQAEASDELLKIKESLLENGIAGVAFVESEEKYKFIDNGEDKDSASEGELQTEPE